MDQTDFNVTEYKKLIDKVSDFTLRLIFKKLSFFHLGYRIKEEYTQLSEKDINILLSFSTTYLCEAGFSSYVSSNVTTDGMQNRL